MPFDDDDVRPVERHDPERDAPGDLNESEGVGTDGSLESAHPGDSTRLDQGDGVGTDGSLETGHHGDVFDERRDR